MVYLISVFTHMLPEECENYAQEIMRVLRPGGRCAVTTFLVDRGNDASIRDWTAEGDMYVRYPATPRKMVGLRSLDRADNRLFAVEGEAPSLI